MELKTALRSLILPNGRRKYLFFGGKGGVGKTVAATSTAVWLADNGFETTIVSTDPTVSLSIMFDQVVGASEETQIRAVPRLKGLNIDLKESRGVFRRRLSVLASEISDHQNEETFETPCASEIAAFDQFVSCMDAPTSDVIVFDTAPTGKTLRELAMPFNWARFLQNQLKDSPELARTFGIDDRSTAFLDQERRRFENAVQLLRDCERTVFTLVLLPERLPIEETHSAISGLWRLGIKVQALVVNQCLGNHVINGNKFLEARTSLQARYIAEIESAFSDLTMARLPLLDRDVSDVPTLREVGRILYGPLLNSS